MTDFEKFVAQNIHTTTIFEMGGDWTNKTEIVRRVNGYSEKAKIEANYYSYDNVTVITVKGV